MPEVLRLDGVLAKIQPTLDVDSVPVVATDAVRISRRIWSQIQVDYTWENLRSDTASGAITPVKPALPRGRRVRIDIFWEVKGAGSDVPPEATALYRACGLAETDGTQLFSYAQSSAAHEMASIYCYAAGLVFKVINCRGRFRWPLVVGEIAMHQFTMMGVMTTEPATLALPGGFVYDAQEPLAGVNSGLTIGGVALDWLSGEFDPVGNDVEQLESGNAADGIREFDYGEVQPAFNLTVRKIALATYDPYADLKARTTRAVLATWGATQFNRVKLVSPTNVCLRSVRHGDGQGFANWELGYFVEAWTLQFD
jgi:hypothetical protein